MPNAASDPGTEVFLDHERHVLASDQPQQVQQLWQRIHRILDEDVGASGHPQWSVRRICLLDRLPQGQDRVRRARLRGKVVGELLKPERRRKSPPVVQTFGLGWVQRPAEPGFESRRKLESGFETGCSGFFTGSGWGTWAELDVVVEGTRQPGGDVDVDAEGGPGKLVRVGALKMRLHHKPVWNLHRCSLLRSIPIVP